MEDFVYRAWAFFCRLWGGQGRILNYCSDWVKRRMLDESFWLCCHTHTLSSAREPLQSVLSWSLAIITSGWVLTMEGIDKRLSYSDEGILGEFSPQSLHACPHIIKDCSSVIVTSIPLSPAPAITRIL